MPTEQIVVGVDGSDESVRALRWAIEGAADREVDVASVWNMPAASSPFGIGDVGIKPDDLVAAADATSARTIEHASVGVDTSEVSIVRRALAGPAGPALVDHSIDAEMLIVGQRGSGGFMGLLLGSVSEYCLHHASVPLAIVPDHEVEPSGRMVVGIDGSKSSLGALRFADAEARRRGLDLVVMTVWSFLGQPTGDAAVTSPGMTAEAAEWVAADAIERTGLTGRAETMVVNDLASQALIDASAAGDTVVVGAFGRSGIRSRFAGSVSRQLAHHSRSPLLIFR